MLHGVDVSVVQGEVDWSKTAYDFVFAKCGNGNDSPDPHYARNMTGAASAAWTSSGISTAPVVIPYHVVFPIPPDNWHPDRAPDDQAEEHFAAAGAWRSRRPMVDVEWPVPGTDDWRKYGCSEEQVRAWLVAYLEKMTALCGKQPVVYDGFPDYWAAIGGHLEPAFAQYPLHVVDYPAAFQHSYPGDAKLLVVPQPWKTATFWQVNGGGGRIPIVGGGSVPVDMDVFLGDEAALAALI